MVKNKFLDAFLGHQNQVLRKDIFQRQKRVLMHLLILSDHQNQVLRKIIFYRLEWLKTCFGAFPGHQNQVLNELIFNLWSG